MEGEGGNKAEIGDQDHHKILVEAKAQKESERLKNKLREGESLLGSYVPIVIALIPTCLQLVVTSDNKTASLLADSEPILITARLFILSGIISCLEFVRVRRTLLEEIQGETHELTEDGVRFTILERILFLESCHKKYRKLNLLEVASLLFFLGGIVCILLFNLRNPADVKLWAFVSGMALLPLLFTLTKLATQVVSEFKRGVDKCNELRRTVDLVPPPTQSSALEVV